MNTKLLYCVKTLVPLLYPREITFLEVSLGVEKTSSEVIAAVRGITLTESYRQIGVNQHK